MRLIDNIRRYGITPDRATAESTYKMYAPMLRDITAHVISLDQVAETWFQMKVALQGGDPVDWTQVVLSEPPFSCFMEVSNTQALNKFLPVGSDLLPVMPSGFGAICDMIDMYASPLILDSHREEASEKTNGEYTRDKMIRLLQSASWQNKVIGGTENIIPVSEVRWCMEFYLVAEFRTMQTKKPIGPLAQMVVLIQPNGHIAVTETGAPCIFMCRDDYHTRNDVTSDPLEAFRDARAIVWLEVFLYAQALIHMRNVVVYPATESEADRAAYFKKTGLKPIDFNLLGTDDFEIPYVPTGVLRDNVWSVA